MAKLKIYQSQLGVKETKLPEVGALTLPFNITHEQGDAFKSFFKDISSIRKSRKATQNQNDARKVILEVDKDIQTKFQSLQLSSNEDDYDNFVKSISLNNYRNLLKPYNKEVKALIAEHIFKEQSDLGPKLYGKILKNHIDETKLGHDKDLNKILFKMSANDDETRRKGYREFTSFFNHPLNKEKYSKAEYQKLYDDKLAEARKMQLQFGIRNDPMWFIKNIDKIIEEVGDLGGALVFQDAANSFVSKEISKDLDEIRVEKTDTEQKIYNFADIVKRLNNKNDPNYQERIPTLDDINDYFKLNQINSAQYGALIDFYDNPDKVSNDRIVDMINAQLAVAKSVEDIDALERQINFDPEFVTQLNINDYSAFKEIFEKYKNDQPGMLNFQHFAEQLHINLDKVEKSNRFQLGGTDTNTKNIQLTATIGMKMYNDLVRKNISPEDAYIQVVERFMDEKTLPPIYNVVQPISIKITAPAKGQVSDPAKWFEDKRKEVLEKYRAGTASMETFQDDLSAIDVMEDMFNVRKGFGDIDFAFSATNKEKKEGDIGK